MVAPPMPMIPSELHGQLVLMALMCYAGDLGDGERALAPFRGLAQPLTDMLQPIPYAQMYPPEPEDYHPIAASRTMFMDSVDESVATTILDYLDDSDASMRATQLRVLGGAMARVPSEATAFAHRQSKIMTNCAAFIDAPEQREERDSWVERLSDALRQSDQGAYVNFLGAEGPDQIRRAYPGPTWDRLVEIKKRYDPTNVFRLNQNIAP